MEKLNWMFELNVVKEYLSRFYGSKSACVREYVANAIAAQHRACVNDPVYVEITPERIVIEDRGIGISKETFRNVFMWFGRSENRTIHDVQGKFGLGAKSFMMLTGDKGKVVMKTRSRETGESYSAILTSTGAEIIEDGGKEDFGTRFEIYPEEKLTPREVGELYDTVANRFDFSRIPVHVKAYAHEPIEIFRITGKEIAVDESDDAGGWWRERVRYVEAIYGIQNHELELVEENEVYEVYKLKTVPYHEKHNPERTAIVVGDVLIDEDFPENGLLVRLKVEDGRTVNLAGLEVCVPEPLPNRDGYRNVSTFKKALAFKLKIDDIKDLYRYYVKLSTHELASVGVDILKMVKDRVIDELWRKYVVSFGKVNEDLLRVLELNLPGFKEFKNLVDVLLTELPAYGVWGYIRQNGRRGTVTVADVLNAKYCDGRNVGYVTKRPGKKVELAMRDENIYAVYTEDTSLIEFLKSHGIGEVKVRGKTKRIKVYVKRRENLEPEYVNLDNFVYDWNSHILVFSDKVGNVSVNAISDLVRVVIGGKKLYKTLKEIFGDFVLTYDEWLEMLYKTTLVTNGNEVFTLEDVKDAEIIELEYTQILPLLKAAGYDVYAFVRATNYTYVRDLVSVTTFEHWVKNNVKSDNWWIRDASQKVGLKGAECLHLLLLHGLNYNAISEELIDMASKFTGVAKGKTMDQLRKLAEPLLEKILKDYGTLRLGRFPIEAIVYRGDVEEFEGVTVEGMKLVNPLIPPSVYEYAGEIGRELRKLYELQDRFGLFGALVYHVETGGEVKGADANEIVKRYLPLYAQYREDWELLVRTAPKVSRALALSVLL